MPQNKYLHGRLNERTTYVTYGGSETDSLKLTVDNATKTISGEVKWDAFLDATAGKAYPSELGARNYNEIVALTTKLDKEIQLAQQHRSVTTQSVSSVQLAQKDLVNELNDIVKTTTSSVNSTRNELLGKIIDEAQRAIDAETQVAKDLQHNIKNVSNLIDTNKQQQDKQNLQLLKSLSDLAAQLSQEVTRALKAETNIAESISQVSQSQDAFKSDVADKLSTLSKDLLDVTTQLKSLAKAETSNTNHSSAVDDKLKLLTAKTEELFEAIDLLHTQDNQIETRLTEIDNLSKVVDEVKQSLVSIENSDTYVKERLETLDESLQTQKQELQRVSNVLSLLPDYSTQINELDTRLAKQQSLIELLSKQLSEEVTAQIVVNNKVEQLSSDVTQLRNESSSNYHEVTAQIEVVQKKLKEDSISIQTLQESLQSVSDQLNQLASSVVSSNEFVTLSLLVDSLSKAQQHQDRLISTLSTSVQANSKTIELSQQRLSNLQSKLDAEITRNADLDVVIQHTLIQHKNAIAELQSQQTAAEDAINQTEDSIDRLQSETKALQRELRSTEEDIAVLASSIIQLRYAVDLNREILEDELDQLSAEVNNSKAETAEAVRKLTIVQSDVDQSKQQIEFLEGYTKEHRDLFFQQTELLQDMDAALHGRINVEIEERTKADNEHSIAIANAIQLIYKTHDEFNHALASRVAELEKRDAELAARDDELAARDDALAEKDAELANQDKLLAEKDEELLKLIANLVVDSGNVEEILTQIVDTRLTALEELTTDLQDTDNRILTDIDALRQEDETLSKKIEELASAKDAVHVLLNDGSSAEAYVQLGAETLTIPVKPDVTPSSIVQRDADGNIHINLGDSIPNDAPIPRAYLEEALLKLKDEIYSSLMDKVEFDFIDGGNAPVE